MAINVRLVALSMDEPQNQVRRLALLPDTAPAPASRARYPRRLVLALLLAGGGFVGWIIALAIRLPARYRANHWDVAWVGFDVMLLTSLLATAWVLARRPHLAPTTFVITAVLLVCDAWFDVTTASGTVDTAVSVVCAAALELPLAGVMARAAHRRLRANPSAPYRRWRRVRVVRRSPWIPADRWRSRALSAKASGRPRRDRRRGAVTPGTRR